MKQRRPTLLWIAIAILWIAFVGLAWFMSQNGRFGRTDFFVYYQAAHLLVNQQPLYNGTVDMVYLYPPLLAQLLIPLASSLSRDAAWAVWFCLNTALLVGLVHALSRRSRRPYWLWLIVPIFLPALEALYIGQVTIILFALFTGAWWAVRHERRVAAGLLLALATWIKVYPVVLIGYFLWKRDWRTVGGALIGGVAFGLLQLLISGTAPMLGMIDILFSLTSSGQTQLVAANASVYGFTSQLFQPHANVTPLAISPVLYLGSRLLITALMVGGLLYLSRRKGDSDLEYGLAVITALLLSPTLFPAGMAPVLLAYALLLRQHPTKRIIWVITLACVVLSLFWLFVIGYTGSPPISGLLLSFGFYTLMITWGVNAFVLWNDAKRDDAART